MFELNGNVWDCYATVAAGAAEIFILPNRGAALSIVAKPAAGAQARVEFCVCSRQALRDGQAIWLDWPAGLISAAAGIDTRYPTTAFRVTAMAGAALVQIAQGVKQ